MDLLVITIILLLALIAIRLSHRSGIPALLLFIIIGMGFNLVGYEFSNYEISEKISTLCLIVIMFYGGFGTNTKMAKPVIGKAVILSSIGVVLTAVLTGLFCHFVLKFDLMESLLLGSIVGSTDYASVSSILVSKKLNLKYNTASLLEIESGSNDPTAYTMTIVFMSVLLGSNVSIPSIIFKQIVFGIVLGLVSGFLIIKLMEKIKFTADGLLSVFIASAMLGIYSIATKIDGNGFLALYICGIYLGNKEFIGKRDVIFFYDGVTQLVEIGLFFILGLLSDPKALIAVLPIAFIIMLFMFFIARPLSVFSLMLPYKMNKNQLLLISVAGLRGAAAIAFAIMVVNSDLKMSVDIYHIVFGICLFSSFIQGFLMPILAKKWNMIKENDTVLKTFNYYQDKSALGFIQTELKAGSKWIGKSLKSMDTNFDFIVVKIERNGTTIVPNGDTILKEGDIIVLGGESHFDYTGQDLMEITLSNEHKWINKKISDLDLPKGKLIIMLQSKGKDVVVPMGDTVLKEGDKVVILEK